MINSVLLPCPQNENTLLIPLLFIIFFTFTATNKAIKDIGMTSHSFPSTCRTSCGHHEIKFPIGIDPGCGTPQLSMSCTNSSTLQMPLNSKLFLVNNIDYITKSIILEDPLMSNCANLNSFSNGLDIDLTNTGLTFGRSNTILLLNCLSLTQQMNFLNSQYDCHSVTCWTFMSACHTQELPASCCQVTDPRNGIDLYPLQCMSYTSIYSPQSPILNPPSWSYGIEMQWTLPLEIIDKCNNCEERKGVCGYETVVEQGKFRCRCNSALGCKGCLSDSCERRRKNLIIGGATAGAFLLVASVACLYLRPWRQRFKKILSESTGDGEDCFHTDTHMGMELAHVMATMTGPLPLRLFPYKELLHATCSFSDTHLLGDGGYGMVYKANLLDGRVFAVKRLNHVHHRRLEHFYNEVRILSQVKHPNLVRLEGFCLEGRDLLLVYEYICNGTLEDHIHEGGSGGSRNSGGKFEKLGWETRLNIACEVAEALAYLHFLVSPPIYHRDVKTSNILLDGELKAKVADFGLSRLVPMEATHVSTGPQGTPGYVDPEYHECYQVTDKSDVFSFGVVLLELISSKRAVDVTRPHNQINLSSLAMDRIQRGAMEELLDPGITTSLGLDCAKSAYQVGELAFRCISLQGRARPDMREVCAQLKVIRSNLNNPQ